MAQEEDCKHRFTLTFSTSLTRWKEPPGPCQVPEEPPELEQERWEAYPPVEIGMKILTRELSGGQRPSGFALQTRNCVSVTEYLG